MSKYFFLVLRVLGICVKIFRLGIEGIRYLCQNICIGIESIKYLCQNILSWYLRVLVICVEIFSLGIDIKIFGLTRVINSYE